MNNLLTVVAMILVIAWVIGVWGLHASGIIHVLLIIALIMLLFKVIRGSSA